MRVLIADDDKLLAEFLAALVAGDGARSGGGGDRAGWRWCRATRGTGRIASCST